MASVYTQVFAAMNSAVVPHPLRNTKPPAATSVARVGGPSPRTTRRPCHASAVDATSSTAKASIIDTRLSRPSSEWVKRTTGRRSSAGAGPK